jgi:hypothetical protein
VFEVDGQSGSFFAIIDVSFVRYEEARHRDGSGFPKEGTEENREAI